MKTLEKGLSAEIETLAKRKLKLPELLHAQKGYVSSAEAVLGAVLQQLNAYATKISYFLDRAKSIFYQYQQLLPVEPVETITPPLPTQIFLSIPAYRVLYDAILRWYKMDALSVATEELLFGAFERSQLYELFCLLWQLNSFKKAGLHCVKVDHYDYAFLSKLKQSQLPNTFYFERKDDQGNLCKLTLFYEPAINAPGDTLPRCENGVELMRTSPLAIDQEAENFQLKHIQSPENLFYTPDFVVRTENAKGKVTWFISDAKYSDYKTVMKERTPEIVLKYLFSTAPVVTNEDVAGVWLFYHWKNSSFLLKSAQLWNPTHRPDVHYEHVQISDMGGSSQWINSVLESLN